MKDIMPCHTSLQSASGSFRVGSWMLALLLPLLLPAGAVRAADVAEGDFAVVVNSDNPVTEMSADELSDMFLRKVEHWPNGWSLAPLDQSEQSSVRLTFTRAIHKRPVGAVKKYWMSQVYSGRAAPPPVRQSDAEVIAFVRANPGAIGYISSASPTPGVKVIKVND